MTLEDLLEKPFEEYMTGCWLYVQERSLQDPIMMYVYEMLIKEPAAIEAAWARRYWYHKNGALK